MFYIKWNNFITTYLITLFFTISLAGCNNFDSEKRQEIRLNVVLLGYDSLACYYGNSATMTDLKMGKLSDRTFMENIFITATRKADKQPVSIILKPTASGKIADNLTQFIDLLKSKNLNHTLIDTLDEKEREFFNTISLQEILSENNEPLHLFLPKESKDRNENVHVDKALVILIFNEEDIYAYTDSIKNGKRFTYNGLKTLLKNKKTEKNLYVIIKPDKTSTYRNTVNMLDLISIQKIKNYKMVDISKEEEKFLNTIR